MRILKQIVSLVLTLFFLCTHDAYGIAIRTGFPIQKPKLSKKQHLSVTVQSLPQVTLSTDEAFIIRAMQPYTLLIIGGPAEQWKNKRDRILRDISVKRDELFVKFVEKQCYQQYKTLKDGKMNIGLFLSRPVLKMYIALTNSLRVFIFL